MSRDADRGPLNDLRGPEKDLPYTQAQEALNLWIKEVLALLRSPNAEPEGNRQDD